MQQVLLNGENVVVDEDVEYLHIPGQQLQAIQCEPKYQTKANDVLCGNRPFKENVRDSIISFQIRVLFMKSFLCLGQRRSRFYGNTR